MEFMPSKSLALPHWAPTDKFDIDGKARRGRRAQRQAMERHAAKAAWLNATSLPFTTIRKSFRFMCLSLPSTGPKMTKSEGDPNGLPGLFFRGRLGD